MIDMFKKYEAIPTELKFSLINKHYGDVFGEVFAQQIIKYKYENNLEEFILALDNTLHALSIRVKKNILKKYFKETASYEYPKLLESGMFWEFFPNLTGCWQEDKEFFINFIAEREKKKEYVKLILG